MGALAEALQNGEPPRQGPPCSVAVAIDQLDDEDQRALLQALETDGIGAPFLQTAIASAGVYPPPDGQIRRHRRGLCKCRGRTWHGMTGRRDG